MAETLRTEGVEAELGATLLRATQQRILGFEILTAPFVVAHLQLYLKLAELGATPDATHRPGVFLTNSLTGWAPGPEAPLAFPELIEEREAATRVKQHAQIIVILGNPPYNRFAGVPMKEEQALADVYKGIRRSEDGRQLGQTELYSRWGIRKHLLDDLYIRFFRLAEERIGIHAPFGVFSFISNNSFLSGRSHPIMRFSLLSAFDTVWIDNLHGNRIASERTPGGESCETIFGDTGTSSGIKVGTAITTWVKRFDHERDPSGAAVYIRDFWGRAAAKRQALVDSLTMERWAPDRHAVAAATSQGPRQYERLAASEENGWRLVPAGESGDYKGWVALDEIFPVSVQGINPNRGLDSSIIATDREVLGRRMVEYFGDIPDGELKARHPELMTDRARYVAAEVRATLRHEDGFSDDKISPYLLFPLDKRFLYYEPEEKLLNEARPQMSALGLNTTWLVAVPQARRESEVLPLLVSGYFDLHLHDRGSVGFPSERLEEIPTLLRRQDESTATRRVANINPEVAAALAAVWGGTPPPVTDLFCCVLGLMYAPAYVTDHADALAHDWARIPLPRSLDLYRSIVAEGERISTLLDPWADATRTARAELGDSMGSLGKLTRRGGGTIAEQDLIVSIAHFGAARGGWRQRKPAAADPTNEAWDGGIGDLYLNEQVYVSNVPEAVWGFELGGYPVVKKWLGYREARRRAGQPLSLTEKDHLRNMIHRIAAILVVRSRLDVLYQQAATDALTRTDLGVPAASAC